MSGGGQQSQNTLHDNSIGWGIMLVILGVLLWIFWHFQAPEVRNIVRWIRFAEIWIAQWPIKLFEIVGLIEAPYKVNYSGTKISFWDILKGNAEIVRFEMSKGRIRDPNQSLFYGITRYNKEMLTFAHLQLFNAAAMQPLKYVYGGLALLAAFWAYQKGPRTYYRTKLNLESLIRRQSVNFPVIAPFVDFNPATQPPRPPGSPVPAELPSFGEALGPEEWIAYNNIPIPDGVINEEAAAAQFSKQLISRWKGAMALEPYQQVLLASFCLKASRKRNESDAMLGRLAQCWTMKNGLDFSKDKSLLKQAKKILKSKDLAANVLSKCNQHAFVTTAMIRALATAREEGGVLAPATFVWLRGYDRTLWYPLNNLGRQSFHMEAIGAMSHYKREKLTQRPIPVPKVDDAVDTIVSYMKSKKARPIPQMDYSKSSKRGIKKAV